jgi:hypothetical protein
MIQVTLAGPDLGPQPTLMGPQPIVSLAKPEMIVAHVLPYPQLTLTMSRPAKLHRS